MPSSKNYLEYILQQLSKLDEITYRAMMNEYILYYQGKIIGGIYDDRLLVKPVPSAIKYIPNVRYESPYKSAKEMLLVDEVDNKEFLIGLFQVMVDECPMPKKR
ncbi:MAG: TfoX/Sxy family protein [Faecalicoccus sp.]|uniref:TfoX/Sxy family protein n=1 Tax=Faecalicoccus sp. TaxID=1971758 RepID=UPI002A90AF28|nr:TfoX/Sxy family protein [Faecalicoccus sp.]MDY5233203.1 TfoX/Sxy family protein [Faecalicoccus sp.]